MSTYTIPNVISRTPQGERVMDVYSRLLDDRIVYLGTEIDDGVANALIAQILHLDSDNPEAPIDLYINSPGGSVMATFALYDTMQYCHAPIATTCVGQALSTTALLLAAGTPGRRSVLPHARVLLHQPSGQGRGTIPDLILAAEEILRTREEIEQALSRHTGQDADTLRRDTDRDRILRAQEIIDYGIADQIIDTRTRNQAANA
ncbi:ATP-dependent Clp protease proteolytic subunit [Gordonia amarae]|uniref:ATP-dependent Clp protease proteolytic subunit n=2 Tax=Gordonia amarae TaxID=36821 RepID=G7GNT9_9ACTN|nr:ATP-dependent Clp protease proteolytic subunit [Gordonia amarae]MCS3878150.1 ATP-dependent Clp protease protease subunit [Gordonia amarae]QHN16820.1 ATP-dependent Clp protease proteolytic subunit [Gordonia amarae]QHN21345.1 ATP-dependent Clp protease proteolytic subunit [Gordonia amarae]QHN30200.1 ATP-dependent Clp protease proteolytic subunit [Gordonia amarae]QHN38973.1 ATP-dependent Clp protease proteolytic subunit [Gordonia amarae]